MNEDPQEFGQGASPDPAQGPKEKPRLFGGAARR